MKNRMIPLENRLYPVTARNSSLHLEPFGGLFRISTDRTVEVNRFASIILHLCNGKNSMEDILARINKKYYSNIFDVVESAEKFIMQSLSNGLVELNDRPVEREMKISGSYDYYSPIHFMIELTETCNLRCRHCYRESGPEKKKNLPTRHLLRILQELYKNGVLTIELTGGEPTLHPDFVKILKFSCERFKPVSIITNGWFIDDDIGKEIGRLKNTVIAQVDLDGDSAYMHDNLRGVKGAFDHALSAIEILAKNGVKFRVAMNVYPRNYDSIESTLDLAKNMGATWFSFSPILDIGRGKNMKVLSHKKVRNFGPLIEKLSKKHPGFFYVPQEGQRYIYDVSENCGAGYRSMVLGPSGEVRPCVMLDEKYFSFGNLIKTPYKDFIKRASTFSSFFRELKIPNIDDCQGCRFFLFCVGCFVRPVHALERTKKENIPQSCAWGKKTKFFSVLNTNF